MTGLKGVWHRPNFGKYRRIVRIDFRAREGIDVDHFAVAPIDQRNAGHLVLNNGVACGLFEGFNNRSAEPKHFTDINFSRSISHDRIRP